MTEGGTKPLRKLTAFELYLKGLYASQLETREGLEEALRCYEQAIRADPGFSGAYVAFAEAYVRAAGALFPTSGALRHAKNLVVRALELEPDSPGAHAVLADVALRGTLDWTTAEAEFREATRRNPGDPGAHYGYSVLLATLQRFEEAEEELRQVIRVNPLRKSAWEWLVELRYRAGDLDGATALAEEIRDRDPGGFDPRWWTGCCYWAAGRVADATRESEELAGPAKPRGRVSRAVLLALLGKPDEAARLVRELEREATTRYVPLAWLADLHAVLHEKEKALDALERDLREGDRRLWLEYPLPQYDELRTDPRFVALLREYRLPTIRPDRHTSLALLGDRPRSVATAPS